MEFHRLLSKKVLLFGVLIYLFQSVAFIGFQMQETGLQEMQRQNKEYNLLIEEYRKLSPDAALSKAEAEAGSAVEQAGPYAKLLGKLRYLAGYEERIEAVFQNAKRAERFRIFQEPDSYTYHNIIRTAEDFERVRGLKPVLERDRATFHTLEFTWLSYFAAAFVIYVLYEVFKERDNGMWQVAHATKNGRYRLVLNRGFSLSVITAAFYLLCFLTNLCLSCLFYGADDFGGVIQSIEAYAKYTYPVSKGLYLCLFAGKSILAALALVFFAYLIFTLLRNRNLAVVLLLSFFYLEFQFMQRISVSSNFKLFRYLNFMRIFDCAALDKEYQNLNLFRRAVSAGTVLFWIEAALIIGCLGLTAVIYERQYPRRGTFLARLLDPAQKAAQKALERLTFSMKEGYKILICKRGLFFLICGIAVCRYISVRTEVTFPGVQKSMDEAYLNYGGADWTVFNEYIADLERQREEYIREAADMQEAIREGRLSEDQVFEVSSLLGKAETLRLYLKEYYEKQEARERLYQTKGIEIYAMSDRGYNEILGRNSFFRETVLGIVMIAVAVVMASQVFGIEKQSAMLPLLKSSGRGIRWVWRRKIYCCLFLTAFVLATFCGGNLIWLLSRYRTPYLAAPIQSVSFLAHNNGSVSLLAFWILTILYKGLTVFGAAGLTLFVSSNRKVRNQMYIPVFIIAFSVTYLLIAAANIAWLFLAGSVFSAAVLICGIWRSYRNWCLG